MDETTVFLVEDFQPLRDSMAGILKRANIPCETFSCPTELIDSFDASRSGCLVLDLQLPEMSGLELQRKLSEAGCQLPFLIISGYGEIPDVTMAMRQGAIDFLAKPFTASIFLERVQESLLKDSAEREQRERLASTRAKLDTLSLRENEVLELILDGRLTKQIATQLGISAKTVENHRSNIAKKMNVDSAVQLVKLITEFYMVTGRYKH
jgi:FixJ family two-component response regulator